MALAIFTGMRRGEIIGLRWEDERRGDGSSVLMSKAKECMLFPRSKRLNNVR